MCDIMSEYEIAPRRTTPIHLPDVVYTGSRIDRSLIADRPLYVQRTESAEYPLR